MHEIGHQCHSCTTCVNDGTGPVLMMDHSERLVFSSSAELRKLCSMVSQSIVRDVKMDVSRMDMHNEDRRTRGENQHIMLESKRKQ